MAAKTKFSFWLLGGLVALLSSVALMSDSGPKTTPLSFPDVVSSAVVNAATQDSSGVGAATLDEVLSIAKKILDNLNTEIRDYQALLVKRERISGKLGDEVRIALKVRNRKFDSAGALSVGLAAYLKFVSPKSVAGREVIWGEGLNEGKLVAHESGFANLMRLNLVPDGMVAMLGNKYPITEIGLVRLVEKLIEKGERDRNVGRSSIAVVENQLVGDRTCTLIQVTHPEPAEGLDFHIAQIFFDPERWVPLRYAAFMWPTQPGEAPPLEEEYTYLNLELNVGLTDADFDPNNALYDYP